MHIIRHSMNSAHIYAQDKCLIWKLFCSHFVVVIIVFALCVLRKNEKKKNEKELNRDHFKRRNKTTHCFGPHDDVR